MFVRDSHNPIVRFRVLGPVAAFDGDHEVHLGGPRPRAVLALLLTPPGRPVPADRLVDEIWREEVDVAGVRASLYTHVSNLRRALGSERVRRGPYGYVLDMQRGDELDAAEFESAIVAAHRAASHAAELATLLGVALRRWDGRPYAGLEDVPTIGVEVTRLSELRDAAEMDRIDAVLLAGGVPPVAEAIAVRDRRPLDERAWSLLIRSLYRAGRQAESLRVVSDLRSMLRNELGLDPSPQVARLEEQVLVQDPALDSNLTVAPEVPGYLSSFVGRPAELAAVADALDVHRLVTITGPGGAGKTRLAVELASQVGHRYPDGVWLVDLAHVTDGNEVIAELAATVHAPAEGANPMGGVLAALAGKRTLVVVDNAEHLSSQVATAVGALLQPLDLLTVLVTSRVALGCPGERVVPIYGLPVGNPDAIGDAERLFVARCRDHGVVLDGWSPDVRSICRRLDGLPLAHALAASRSSTASPAEMAQLLDRRDVVLTDRSQPRDIHRSLETTIGWSYDHLCDRDRAAFATLGVFEGPFDAAAAAAVLESRDECDALDTLSRLVTSSVVTSRQVEGHMTYRLLEMLRAFARDRLVETERWDEAVTRHDNHCITMALELADEFLGRGRVAATRQFVIELADHLAAWDRLIAADPDRLLPLGWALGNVWLFEGRLVEGASRLLRLINATTVNVSAARGDVLVIASWVVAFRNDMSHALSLAEEGLALYQACGTPERIAYGLARVGHWAFALGDGEAGMAHLKESITLCERIGFDGGVAWPLVLIAQARRWSGDDSPDVREMLLDARRRFRELGESYGQIHADMLLSGFTAFDPEERLGFATEMVNLSSGPGGENLMRPIALHNLAYSVADCGDVDRALGLNRAALRSSLATGATMDIGLCLLQAASFSAAGGDLVRAATLLGAGLANFGMEMAPFQEELLAPIRVDGPAQLGNDRYAELLRIGRALSAEDAARMALETRGTSPIGGSTPSRSRSARTTHTSSESYPESNF